MEDYSKYEESIDSEVGSYASFEGKEILVIDDRNGDYEEFRAIVSGCDYDIGISIEVSTDEEKWHIMDFYNVNEPYLFCLNGPSAKGYKDTYHGVYGFYDELFNMNIKEIKEGIMYVSNTIKLMGKYTQISPFLSMSECSFK